MRIPGPRHLALLALLVLSSIWTGCSTLRPAHSGRMGFLDRRGSAGSPGTSDRKPASSHTVASMEATRVELNGLQFQWPLKQISVTSEFGQRGADFHEGVDLRAQSGTAVQAAEAGVCLYADKRIRGYGKMVVIRHANGFSSIYAHNSRLLVRKGQQVKKGQKIALSGNTGHSTGPHLHFEVRKGVAVLDPIQLLNRSLALASAKQSPPLKALKPLKGRKGHNKRALASAH